MEKHYLLAPSLLSADFTNLKDSFSFMEANGVDLIHLDVMDGHFVPNLTFGPFIVKQLRTLTHLPFDVHLMVSNPESLIEPFIDAGANWLTFHYEAAVHSHRLISLIKELNCKAGISIVPSTPVAAIKEILPFVDLVLIMSVNPGFGGQKMIPECLNKIVELKKIKRENDFSYIVSIDGGVNSQTIDSVVQSGADVIVSGSAFFTGELSVK